MRLDKTGVLAGARSVYNIVVRRFDEEEKKIGKVDRFV